MSSTPCKPNELVAFAWGSRSTSKIRLPDSANAALRFTAVVVLPTPPFWLAIATIFISGRRATNFSSSRQTDTLRLTSPLPLEEGEATRHRADVTFIRAREHTIGKLYFHRTTSMMLPVAANGN